jgi:peptide chain release factor 2
VTPRLGWTNSGGIFDVPGHQQRISDLEGVMATPGFWDSKEKAQETVKELSASKRVVEPFGKLRAKAEDFTTLAELAAEDGGNAEMLAEADAAWTTLSRQLNELELLSFLSGRFDKNNAIITLSAGAGGTESQDWCEMLLRMYLRWVERRGFGADIMDVQPGEVAGLKSAMVLVNGLYAYGYLKAERGVHRLVRISPFDSNKRRHTSFAALDVAPEFGDDIDITIDEKDLKVDTFRSTGAGGQHVNKTDSAVRMTHIPTGVIVVCRSERSQHQNRDFAMKALKAKLYARQVDEKEQARHAETGPKGENAFGSQIRNYVLHPYQLVKDVRTDVETSNTAAVLDGDLDKFIEAFLRLGVKA